jgi:protein-S-isoprenylcysteine O-methyltransferase Ste14
MTVMSLRATELEFRYRVWFISLSFWLGFSAYFVDHRSTATTLAYAMVGESSGALALVVRVVAWVGTGLVALAALLRTWASSYLASAVVHDQALHTEALVADGPYRRVRNPLYLGTILMAAGVALLASPLGFFIIVVCVPVVLFRLILLEESRLLSSQGESFARYVASVPRLLPSLTPRVPSGGRMQSWKDGLRGEAYMWTFAVAMGVHATTGGWLWFGVVGALGLAIVLIDSRRR